MPDVFQYLFAGVSVALSPNNLFVCFIGVFIGTLVGVLPGVGPVAGLALLLPTTYHMSPMASIILLAGIFYGTQYGGSTTSILMNIPGEAASVVTCIDGYQMAKKGRAGSALGISAFGSFIGGTLGVIGLMLIAPPLAMAALAFGPPEYFSLLLLGLLLVVHLGEGSKTNSWMMAIFGLCLGTVGIDQISGRERFVYGVSTLFDGIGLTPVAMGLFGISEVLLNISEIQVKTDVMKIKTRFRDLLPDAQEWRRSIMPIGRGSILGFLLGVLPGAGVVLSSFSSYVLEKRLSKHPQEFGKGAIEGVAGPESANNASVSGCFIPLLTLGVPASAVTAILLGAFLIHGLQPGPLLMKNNPLFFWGIIGSMYIGNVMLLVLNLPLIGLWVQILKIPYAILFPLILMFAIVGCYSVSYNIIEVFIMAILGLVGYFLRKAAFSCAPIIFGVILSPMLETSFRQSLLKSEGSLTIFIEHPISLTLLILFLILVLWPLMKPAKWMSKVKNLEGEV
jgi:putative tricarboxylic transport membrane protein